LDQEEARGSKDIMAYLPVVDKRVTTETNEGETAMHTVPGHVDIEVVHIDVDQSATTTTGYMVVDLSDTTNWSHTNTGHIDIAYIKINVNPTATFVGDIELGFLTNVDATNGDFNGIMEWHLDKKQDSINEFMNFGAFEMSQETAHWFGPTTANDTVWQTDVNLQGPDGATSYPSGSGDLVMHVTATTSDVAVGLTIGYRTHA